MIIDNKEFSGCVQKYEKLIVTICLTFTKNYFDAEDLAQETFLSAYKNLDKFDGKNIKAWLATIAANKCRDYLKSPLRNTNTLSAEDYNCIEDEQVTPAEHFEQKDMEEKIHTLCFRLKEPYQSVALGYFCLGTKLSEMAIASNQSVRTLQTQLYRSKKLLRALWEEECM